ncbi:MAG: PA0069 family radical SAM protein [Methyloligellaceae bacterium]
MTQNPKKIIHEDRRRGRGSRSNISGRYENLSRDDFDDGWGTIENAEPFKTEVFEEKAKTVLTTNKSPDIPFEQSINPYRGCEHGCPYCFARPTHAYMGLSPGLDFESKLYVKVNAAEVLRKELAKPKYVPKMIAMGTNTDPYQPIERKYKITRTILEVCNETNHPVGVVTKSALVTRDIDILAELARKQLTKVGISVTTLDRKTARSMEPRASTPSKRLEALKLLHEAGIPTMVMVAPVVPGINDHEIEAILDQARLSGVSSAHYVLLRLPLELKDIMKEWLETDFPDRAKKVYNILRSMRGGQLYNSEFGERMTGDGAYARLIQQRFEKYLSRHKLNKQNHILRTDIFVHPRPDTDQMELF